MKTDPNDPKSKGRVRRRNMVAKAKLLEEKRTKKPKVNDTPKFNKHKALKMDFNNEDEGDIYEV